MNAGNRARISWHLKSEARQASDEPVVTQPIVYPEEGTANRIDDRADQQREEEVAEDLVDPRKPCSVADKVLLNGGHSDHDLVNQR